MHAKHALLGLVLAATSMPAPGEEGAPLFNVDGALLRPVDYRQWVFVTSGLGMTYGPARPRAGEPPRFSNVFVNPEAYRAFVSTGRWPDGTFFVLEIRRSMEHVSIDGSGSSQGEQVLLEASVKQSERYPDGGWAYFAFDGRSGDDGAAAPLPRTASCYGCHAEHAAVEWTFTQFYPDLFEVARTYGTVREDYDPTRKLE